MHSDITVLFIEHPQDFPSGTGGKEPACQCRRCKRCGLDPWVGEANGNPLQYYCLENPMNRGAWWATQSIGSQIAGHDWSDLAGRELNLL